MQERLKFPHDELTGNEVIIDYLEDNRRRLHRLMVDVDAQALNWRPHTEANDMALTLWHMGRLLDVFLTQHALGAPAESEVWHRRGFTGQTGYDPRGWGDRGWGTLNRYSADELAGLPHFTKTQLLGYLDAVYDGVIAYLRTTPMSRLRTAAPGFAGQYTCFQVISMAILDNIRHLGELYTLHSLHSWFVREASS